MSTDIILVTGATGNIGTALVAQLARDPGQPLVRATTRDIQSPAARLLHAMNPTTVQPIAFDANDPASLHAACEGITKICIIAPFAPDMADWHTRVVEAAKAVGTCTYAVKVSVTGARSPESSPPPGRIPLAHWKGEEAIRSSGIPSTMIRPPIFMQHFLTVPGLYQRGDEQFYLPTGQGKIAFLDCRDIAMMAAALVQMVPNERTQYEGQAYELSGPAALTASEIGAILSWAAERPMTHVDGMTAFEAHCQALGTPDVVKNVYKEAAEGWFAPIEYAAFERATGQRPTSFAKFAYDHAAFFQA